MKLVILDRDGTLSEEGAPYVKTAQDWKPLPGALEAIARLNQEGWHVVIATNQAGLGRGLFDVDALNAIHTAMHKKVVALGGRIEAVFFCPHAADEDCACRKPKPGLFHQIAERYGVDLKQVPAVGDSVRDLQAAAAAGCEPHLLRTGKSAALKAGEPLPPDFPPNTQVHNDLPAFVEYWLQRHPSPESAD